MRYAAVLWKETTHYHPKKTQVYLGTLSAPHHAADGLQVPSDASESEKRALKGIETFARNMPTRIGDKIDDDLKAAQDAVYDEVEATSYAL